MNITQISSPFPFCTNSFILSNFSLVSFINTSMDWGKTFNHTITGWDSWWNETRNKQQQYSKTYLFRSHRNLWYEILWYLSLIDYGIGGHVLKWLKHYICNQKQTFVICTYSRTKLVSTGVIQGSMWMISMPVQLRCNWDSLLIINMSVSDR